MRRVSITIYPIRLMNRSKIKYIPKTARKHIKNIKYLLQMVVCTKIFPGEGDFLVDSATALQWRYLPWSTGPLHCNGVIYHGRQVRCIAMALSTMVDRSIALQWRYLPWSTGPLHCNGVIYHGRQVRCIAMALSTTVDRSVALQWRYLPKTKPPPQFSRHFHGGQRGDAPYHAAAARGAMRPTTRRRTEGR